MKKSSRILLMREGYFQILPHSPPKLFTKSGVSPPEGAKGNVSLFYVILRSFTSVQDDKSAKKVSCGSTSILLPK